MLLFFLLILYLNIYQITAKQPHVIVIVADDLGWNDVGFHGSSQIPTPNIDALAYSGRILNNYYVLPICTPSRSALMTGKYPIHTGMQHGVLYGAEPRGLPLNETLLPEYLRRYGYATHCVGKWHLGSYKKEYTPLYRGCDTHFGFWTGHQDYYDHTAVERPGWGLDMRRGMGVAYDVHGQYSTDLFTQAAVDVINSHNKSRPLFLYLAHTAVHSANPYNPLPAPDELVGRFMNITDYRRQRFAAVLTKLDESVGKVFAALDKNAMVDDCLIVFTTDNGGPAAGFNLNAASNYPLRGVKNTLWEGGVKGAAFIWSPLLERTNKHTANQLMHITDWFPTILRLAGATVDDTIGLDGVDQWLSLSENSQSPRNEILLNIDDEYGNAALLVDDWKLIKGTTYQGTWDNWYGPTGRDSNYNIDAVIGSMVGQLLIKQQRAANQTVIWQLQNQSNIECGAHEKIICQPLKNTCLFNLKIDPCEMRNLARIHPDIVERLEIRLVDYNRTAIPPGNLPLATEGNPKYHNYIWTNFGDIK